MRNIICKRERNLVTKASDEEKNMYWHKAFSSQKIQPAASLPACLLGQILTGLQLPSSSHGFCCFVDYTTSGRVRSKSRCNFSHHLHYMCWMHNWFTEFTCCSELKSSYVCTCYMSPDWNFTEYWQSWILLDNKYWNMNAECRWSWLKKNRILKFTSGAAASSSAWLRDRWCTRWCLRPAESGSSWSSAVRLKLSGFRFKEKAGADGHRCALQSAFRATLSI